MSETRKAIIVHDLVGMHQRGQTVDLSVFEDPQPLLDIGAIMEVFSEEPPTGPTMSDLLRSSSPPTLPTVPAVAQVTRHEALVAAGMLPPDTGITGPGGASYVGPPELLQPRRSPSGKSHLSPEVAQALSHEKKDLT